MITSLGFHAYAYGNARKSSTATDFVSMIVLSAVLIVLMIGAIVMAFLSRRWHRND